MIGPRWPTVAVQVDGWACWACRLARLQPSAAYKPGFFIGLLGGEEFGLLLPETGREAALAAIARLQEAVRGLRVPAPSGEVRFTFSAGLTEARPDDRRVDDLFQRSDAALYRAKAGGRDRAEDG